MEAEAQFGADSLASLSLMLGNLLRHQSDYERAGACYKRGLACPSDALDARIHASLLGGLGEIAFRQGHYADATDYYQFYLEIGRQAGDEQYMANAINALGRLATVKGNFAEALDYHRYGQHLCETNEYSSGLAWMFNARGELERARGNSGKAAGHFRESAAIFDRLGDRGAQMLALQNLGFALLSENPSGSETLLQKTLRFWEQGPARHGMSLALVGLSRVDLARGNAKKAGRQLATASQVLRQIGVQLELGDRMDYEIAYERLTNALGPVQAGWLFEQAGTVDHSDAPSARSLPVGMALTSREAATLRLAAQGLTDRQIAEELVISPHTVNAHLKSIYRKLSVNNRTAAVAAARNRHIL
jgi:ATP/maltotriose-dependent transcriptional regulator MalT